MNIKEKINQSLNNFGYDLNDEELLKKIDSLTFISMILELEEIFEIEIPDSLLNYEILTNIDTFVSVLNALIEDKHDIKK